jgi:hypothetical protein
MPLRDMQYWFSPSVDAGQAIHGYNARLNRDKPD